MKNPFLANRTNTMIFTIAWILLAGIQTIVLWLVSSQDMMVSITDSLIFNALLAGISIGLWYSFRYYDFNKSGIAERFLNHLLIAVLVLGAWLGTGYMLMKLLVPEQPEYQVFLNDSMPWRGIAGLFLYSLVVLVYYLYINSEDRKARISREASLQIRVKEAEIDRLKAQINPHFLFNSLNSVSSLIESRPEQAREMLVRLSGFLRYSLENRDNNLTALSTELENILYYLEIEKVRFGARLCFEFQVPDECLLMRLPHMLLQPLIENAIKHGVYESTEPVRIELAASRVSDETLAISVSNDFDPEAPPRKGKGIGLINTRNRLALEYNCNDCMEVVREETRFTVKLKIPQH